MKSALFTAAALAMLAACTQAAKPETAVPAAPVTAEPQLSPLETAIAGSWRPAEETARDVWRHPKETLEFFGVAANHKVIEVSPGGGWYTQILGPYLKSGGGTLVVGGPDINSVVVDPKDPATAERRARVEARIADFSNKFSNPIYGTIEYSAFSKTSGPLTAPGSADVVLTFRNVHNWMAGGFAEKFFTDSYAALKPGGVLGVVEHRLPSTEAQHPKAESGYVHEDYVKSLAKAAGFEFVAASEINANPADTANHPCGVWSLSPVSRAPDKDCKPVENFDAEAYKAIGESDRMTLKFRKPVAAAPK
jgi:predicted methyltransferase